jgi:hypothetical protein
MNRLRCPLLAAILLTTAACSMFGNAEDEKVRHSPNFQQGYEDGCASANQQGADFRDRQVKDPTLYKTDDAYRAGWSNGFSSCRTTTTPNGTQPGSNPLNGAIPSPH